MDENKTILVVEDEESLRKALVSKLGKEGFSVLEAANGEAGLKVALKEQPDVLLVDIVMPKVDGMAMIKQLREDEWGQDARVILLTNLSEPEKVAEAMQYRVYDFLVKANWKIEDVVKKVREKLGD